MIKGEPLLLSLLRKRREPLIDRWPITKHLKPLWFAFLECLLHIKKTLVTHLMDKLHIDTYCIILKQEPACFGYQKALLLDNHCTYRKRRLQEYLNGIGRKLGLLGYLLLGKSFWMSEQSLQDTELHHKA